MDLQLIIANNTLNRCNIERKNLVCFSSWARCPCSIVQRRSRPAGIRPPFWGHFLSRCALRFWRVPAILIVEVISRLVGFMPSWPQLCFLVGVALNFSGIFFFWQISLSSTMTRTQFCSLNYPVKCSFLQDYWYNFEFSLKYEILLSFYGHVKETEICVSHRVNGGAAGCR